MTESIATLVENIITEALEISNLSGTIIGKPSIKKKPKIFSCGECGKKFSQYVSASKHCNLSKIPRKVSCSVCSRQMDKKNLQRHLKVHEVLKPPPLRFCDLCKIAFSSKQKLENHQMNIHKISVVSTVDETPNLCAKGPNLRY